MRKIFSIILLILIIPITSLNAESIYPSGNNVSCQYLLSSQSITTTDTLIITRTLTNNSSFSLSGLYFSDNFPGNFSLIDYSIKLNGVDISYQFEDSVESIFSGNNYYYWIIDNPDGSIEKSINQGDSLTFTMKLICNQIGSYVFPLHTSTFYGNSTAFFATEDLYDIIVSTAADQTPPSGITNIEAM